MPWKETCPVNERMKFVVRLQQGERMTDLCKELGISRKTGHKIWKRFQEHGPSALLDQSRAPARIPHRTSLEIRGLLVETKKAHPTWGPKKLRAWLERKQPGVRLPASSTIGEILKQEGLVNPRMRRKRGVAKPTSLTTATAPNEVWCTDFKGQFRLGNGTYCYPLTITDRHSRFLIACVALDGTKAGPAQAVFEEVFEQYGLPGIILSDNGVPFSTTGLAGLSELSAWWLRLGINPERIEPGHPEQNGQHERMHLTLKKETTRPAGANMLQQQERFDCFREEFNQERPHEALGQRPPATEYRPSERAYADALREPDYPLHDVIATVSSTGSVWLPGRRCYYVARALAGQPLGLREMDDGRWLVTFMNIELGHIEDGIGFDPLAELI